MLQIDRNYLPPSEELADSDDIPVDNEDQNWVPNVLLLLLKYIWAERNDWFFGVDMGIYHPTGINARVPIVPDGFLSLGVERRKGDKSRRSYVVWEEQNVAPIFTLEVVSWTPGGEYDAKMSIYAKLSIRYYIIYNPEFWQRDRHQPLEIYQLIDGNYQLQIGEPYWMPEIGLGIGRCQERSGIVSQEVLAWFDEGGNRYLRPEEEANIAKSQAAAATARAETAEQKLAQLAAQLRALGEDPNLS